MQDVSSTRLGLSVKMRKQNTPHSAQVALGMTDSFAELNQKYGRGKNENFQNASRCGASRVGGLG